VSVPAWHALSEEWTWPHAAKAAARTAALVGSRWGVTRVVAAHNTGAARVDTGPLLAAAIRLPGIP